VPSFRRFRSANVTTDETPVKGWPIREDSCEIGPANGPAALALVLRFRRSHHVAAHSVANVGIKRSTRTSVILVRFLNLKFPERALRNDRNFKFTALAREARGLEAEGKSGYA